MTRFVGLLCLRAALFGTALYLAGDVFSQEAPIRLVARQLSGPIHVISTVRPNGYELHAGVSVGDDGVLVVDALTRDEAVDFMQEIRHLTGEPVKFVINTHIHSDHTGANHLLREDGATIIRARDDAERFRDPDESDADIGFSGESILRFNGEAVHLTRFEAHSGGDTIVHFPDSNVLFMGDTFLSEWLPQVRDWRVVYEFALSVSDDATVIVPGHGPVTNRQGLERYVELIDQLESTARSLHAQGAEVDDIIADNRVLALVDQISRRYGSAEGQLKDNLQDLLRTLILRSLPGTGAP